MKKMTVLLSLSMALGASTLSQAFAGGAGAPTAARPAAAPACMSITDILLRDPQFSTLLTAVQTAKLNDTLRGGSYTVFAPTNAAFAKLPQNTLSNLLGDPAAMKSLLLYHVLPGKVNARQLTGLQSAKTVNGANVMVRVSGNRVLVNSATVIRADVPACNGVIHVIDTVLMPPLAAAPAPRPAPVAAPAPAPAPLVATAQYSVTNIPVTPPGGRTSSVTVGVPVATPVTVVTTTTTTTGAVPVAVGTDTTTQASSDTTAQTSTDITAQASTTSTAGSVYDVLSADDRFSTLTNLLSDSGLDTTLMSGTYTVFAPTNDAFAKLSDDQLAVLSSNPDLLKQVLLYHVVMGAVPASQVATSTTLTSAEGSALPISVSGGTVRVGAASVVATDITAGNGVIHAIDTVLIPPDVTIPAPPTVQVAPASITPSVPATTPSVPGAVTPSAPAAVTTPSAPAAVTPSTPVAVSPAITPSAPSATTPSAPAAITPSVASMITPSTPSSVTSVSPVTAAPIGRTQDNRNATASQTMLQVITSTPRFSVLSDLLTRSGLITTLGTAGPFTLYAPTNDAFGRLTPDQLARLTSSANLATVLQYHLVSGSYSLSQAISNALPTAVGGATVQVQTAAGGKFTVNGANVLLPELQVSNGYIEPIDNVLVPPSLR